MKRLLTRSRLAVKRGMARADTWVGVLALFGSGWRAADGSWIAASLFGVVGIVFVIASGDFAWRKGYVAGKRESSGTP